MHIVGCVASCTCVWWMYKHWFVLFMFVYVINFISRLIFEPTLGTSERVRHMWEIKDFTFKSGARHQVKFFVDPGHIAQGDRNFVIKDAPLIYKALQRLQQHDKAPYT